MLKCNLKWISRKNSVRTKVYTEIKCELNWHFISATLLIHKVFNKRSDRSPVRTDTVKINLVVKGDENKGHFNIHFVYL